MILNDASVARGGATSLALLAARELCARGHAVTYVSGDRGDDGSLARHGVRLLPLGGRPLLKRNRLQAAGDGLADRGMAAALRDIIAREDTPDTVYHVHGWGQILSPSIFGALAPVSRRCFVHAHDFFLACPNGSYFDFPAGEVCRRSPLSRPCIATQCDRRSYAHKAWRLARQSILRRLFHRGDWAGILQLHPGMADGLIRGGVPADRLVTVRNPAGPLTAARIQAERNVGLCFIGRTEPGKGVALLCEAARLTGLPLRIIGPIDNRPDLPQRFPEVEFTGWVDRSELPYHITDRAALVMPSRFPEPFGLVAAEASLSGLPVAVSGNALLSSDIQSNGLGMTVRVDSPKSLAADLTALMSKPSDDLRAMSEAGFARLGTIAQTTDNWVSQLLGLYDGALERVA